MSTHGPTLSTTQLRRFMEHVFTTNLNRQERGETAMPICIWGTHGIGKTASVKDFAKRNGWRFTYAAPAQMEEMGDLHGLPTRIDPDPNVQGDERTVFLPPEWVPTEPGPGILLLDDVNRADDRILRGIMQLLQEFELFSWKLPPKWQIVCTANPEGGAYSVTPMDDAMLTRMLNVNVEFDLRSWATWATEAGVDPRGISFVLRYPEIVDTSKVTPRSLTHLFAQIRDIADLRAESEFVYQLAAAAVDPPTAATFIAFVNTELDLLIDPVDILDAPQFAPIAERIEKVAWDKKVRRVDVLSVIVHRLLLHVRSKQYKPTETHGPNLCAFLKLDAIPADMRFALHRDLVSMGPTVASLLHGDKELAKLVLGSV
jgi:hypothetical protein